jgi:hypothetical protein
MGTIVALKLIESVARTLQDNTNIRWTKPELLDYLNDGQREIVLAKPDAYVVNKSLQLVAGCKQVIPADGYLFQRVACDLGVSGATPGRVPRHVDMRIFDEQNPNWRADPADPVALHYTFDDKDPKRFYVWPPQPAVSPHQVEIVYSAAPPDTSENAPITLDDLWKNALVNYMLYRATSKDAEYTREDGLSTKAYATFAALVGLKSQIDDKEKATR